jgi:glutaredoxin 1
MITVYGKPGCTLCEQAKALSRTRGLEYNYIELDVGQPKNLDGEYISRDDFTMLFPDARAVPQILVDNVHIGGYTEFQQYLKEQKNDSI